MFTQKSFAGAILCVSFIAFTPLLVAADDQDGFKPIFDGKTLDGWDGAPGLWRVEDGAITGETTADKPLKANTFLIWRLGDVDDFEIKFEYRIRTDFANSGLQYRSFENPKQWGKWVVGGYQADIDSGLQFTGALYGERYRGMLAQRGQKVIVGDNHRPQVVEQFADPAELGKVVKKNDWNSYRVVAKGFRFVQEINGQLMCEAEDQDMKVRRRGGILAFQMHVGPPMKIQLRNILLKRLPMEGVKKVVFVAGTPSHGYGDHEHNAGFALLAKDLNESGLPVYAAVYRNGWPKDPTTFDNANAIVTFSDGGGGNMVLPHLDELDKVLSKGVGLAVLHYALDVPKGKGGDAYLRWIGGYYEQYWSVNPHWRAEFKTLPDHPITRGVKPFAIEDEWYYHMRFVQVKKGLTPILTATPPDETRKRPDGPHSGNPAVRQRMGQAEDLAWAYERPTGGRGFGFTGCHFHWNWAHDDFRKLVLNAIVWVAGAEVPAEGVPSKTPTLEELQTGLDKPVPPNFNVDAIRRRLGEWSKR
jgi:hypothetical protein